MIYLIPPTRDGCEMARQWRNLSPETLRTPFPLSAAQQEAFYQSLQDRDSPNKYWEIWDEKGQCGFGGLTGIQWVNGLAEISLVISPARRGFGLGSAAVGLLLEQAFDRMRLHQVWGEVYTCGNTPFWIKQTERWGGTYVRIPSMKYWGGIYYDAIRFSIEEHQYRASRVAADRSH